MMSLITQTVFSGILFCNLTLHSICERFRRLTGWECRCCVSRALGWKPLSERSSGSCALCRQSAAALTDWSPVDQRAGSGRPKSAYMAETKILKLKITFPKVVQQQHYVGDVSKSVTFVLRIIWIYSVPSIVQIGHHTCMRH